jgi:hypothetical protein
MQEVLTLTYNKNAYWNNDVKVVCADAIGTKARKISLTVSTVRTVGAVGVSIYRSAQGWQWARPGMKYPLVVYDGATQILDSFFPDTLVSDTKIVWLTVNILEE